MQIEITNHLAAALLMRGKQIARRSKAPQKEPNNVQEALEVILRDNRSFDKLYTDIGGSWPAENSPSQQGKEG